MYVPSAVRRPIPIIIGPGRDLASLISIRYLLVILASTRAMKIREKAKFLEECVCEKKKRMMMIMMNLPVYIYNVYQYIRRQIFQLSFVSETFLINFPIL